jgi:putative DNA primase/helicase
MHNKTLETATLQPHKKHLQKAKVKDIFSSEGSLTDQGKKNDSVVRDLMNKAVNLQLDTIEQETREYHLTELGNAERFADQHREKIRFVPEWKKWIVWNGKRWEAGANEKVRKLAHKTVKGFYKLAAEADTTETAAKLGKWAANSCRSAAITAMLKEAASLLSISPNDLDSNIWLFNCNNCTINLKTGKIHKHRREDFITKSTPTDFLPEAKAPTFERVLKTCLADNQEKIDFVQRYFGYATSGSTKEQCFSIFYGSGANGKTTIINPIAEALGDYAQTTRPETLMVKRSGSIPSDLAKLKGSRLVTAAEAEDGHRLAESQIKQMTGGEKIQARVLYQDWFEYTPEFKVVLCTNHKPVIRGQDHAIWRRIRLVPFTVTIPKDQQDKDLPEKLQKELPGILNWIITGAAMWLRDGLGNSGEIQQATDEYRSEQNIIDNFLEGQCTVKDNASAEAGQLFETFDDWRQQEGHRKITQTKFGRMLVEIGFEKSRNSTGRIIYQGIGINQ